MLQKTDKQYLLFVIHLLLVTRVTSFTTLYTSYICCKGLHLVHLRSVTFAKLLALLYSLPLCHTCYIRHICDTCYTFCGCHTFCPCHTCPTCHGEDGRSLLSHQQQTEEEQNEPNVKHSTKSGRSFFSNYRISSRQQSFSCCF